METDLHLRAVLPDPSQKVPRAAGSSKTLYNSSATDQLVASHITFSQLPSGDVQYAGSPGRLQPLCQVGKGTHHPAMIEASSCHWPLLYAFTRSK